MSGGFKQTSQQLIKATSAKKSPVSFLYAEVKVDVLTANNNDVKLVETRPKIVVSFREH